VKPKKVKKCKACKSEFTPFNSMAKACSPKCALELVELDKKKKIRKDLLEYRKETKSISKWISEAQVSINAYVRIRDHDKPCISCGTMTVSSFGGYRGSCGWDAGHFKSTGSSNHLRFNLHNIHKQCVRCNRDLSGNVNNYRDGLISRIGLEKVEILERTHEGKKYTREYCERVKRIFNKKTRMRKRRLGID